jgi:hypothetical protein
MAAAGYGGVVGEADGGVFGAGRGRLADFRVRIHRYR